MEEQEFIERALRWRAINPSHVCPTCEGSGQRLYGSSTTWAGGIGGQVMTHDVCDDCWGSGDLSRPGVNLKKILSKR